MNGAPLIAFPYARRADVAAALRAYLGRENGDGDDSVHEGTLSGSELGQLHLKPHDQLPRTFALYERPVPTEDAPAVMVVSDGRWDLDLAAALSREIGGFAIAAESFSSGSHLGVAAFYAGVTLQTWTNLRLQHGRTPASPLDVTRAFQELLRKAMQLDGLLIEPMLRPNRSTIVELISTEQRPHDELVAVAPDGAIECAFFATDPDRFEKALEQTPGITGKIAYTSLDVPYGVVNSVSPKTPRWRSWSNVQRTSGGPAFGVTLDARSELQYWYAGPSQLPVFGRLRGAHALLDRAASFAMLLDTTPADLRVPAA